MNKNYEYAQSILNGDIDNKDIDIDLLVEILTEASDLYANDGESFLSDSEYDSLFLILQEIDPTNLFLTGVGSDVRGEKVKLPYQMGGLDQLYNDNDIANWISQNKLENKDIVIAEKLDGASAMIIYDTNGDLQISYSRGNGTEGADTTRHIRKIGNIPKKVSGKMVVRGEIIIAEEDFSKIKEILASQNERNYKNPRNFTAGMMNREVALDVFYQFARFVAYEIIDIKDLSSLDKTERMLILEKNRFDWAQWQVNKGKELNSVKLAEILSDMKQYTRYALDGLVLSIEDTNIVMNLDKRASSIATTGSKKFKVSDQKAEADVISVLWRVTKTGYMKPRVHIKPIELGGTTIQYATGFNAKFIKDNNIGPGAKIEIVRAGDVIPYINNVIKKSSPQLPDNMNELEWTENEVDLFLTNIENNKIVQFEQVNDFFGSLGVPNFRNRSVKSLFDAGFDTVEKIIKMSKNDIQKIIGDVNGEKIFLGIKEKLNPVEQYILAGSTMYFGRGIGVRKMKKIYEHHETIFNLSLQQIRDVEGFELNTATKVYENMHKFEEFLKSIKGYYEFAQKKVPVSDKLNNIVVVFTGVRDKALEQRIESLGGKLGSSVNAKTTHLVCKDPSSNSSKMVKARELGVKVIGLDEAKNTFK